jgi:hypothetical protein
LACLATIGLWARTQFYCEEDIVCHPGAKTCFIWSDADSNGIGFALYYEKYRSIPSRWYAEPCGYKAEDGWMIYGDFNLSVSYLSLLALTAATPFLVFVLPWIKSGGLHRMHRIRRIKAGFCAGCGYNLCATPNRCPECGKLAGKVADLQQTQRPRLHKQAEALNPV